MLFKKLNFLLVVMFFVCSSIINGAQLGITKVYSNEVAKEVTFAFDTNEAAKYVVNYDEKNQLIFLEIKNSELLAPINTKQLRNKEIADFKYLKMDGGTGFFITQTKGQSFRVTVNKGKLVIKFDKNIKKRFTIVIDPGHGGKDPGATTAGVREKDIVLNVAKYLRDNLSKDFNVILTRGSDNFISLAQRPGLANKKEADMFISLHANANNSRTPKGVDVFYFSKTSSPYAARIAQYENSFGDSFGEKSGSISQILGELEYKKYQEVSAKLAKGIANNLSSEMRMKNNGIQGANFAVLRGLGRANVAIPGVLVELGFLTNPDDRSKLVKTSNQKVMANSIAEEVRKYF